MKFIIKGRTYFIVLSLFIFSIDQLCKYFISLYKDFFIKKDFILFTFDYVKNFGAAFNMFSGSRILLSIVSSLVSFFLFYLILTQKNTSKLNLYSYSFFLGGSLGNGIDRILNGYVVDFINLNFVNFAIFNIADVAINIGFILIVYSLFKNNK